MQINSMGSSGMSQMLQQMQQKMQTAFSNADTDGDGALSSTEFATFDAAMKADAPQGASGNMPSASEMFSKMDSNGDGSVTLSEIQSNAPPPPPLGSDAMSALLQSQEASSNTGTNPILQAFQNADADGDGSLSQTEFAAFDAAMKANMEQSGSSGASSTGPSASEMFSKLDTNGDGKISQDEAMTPPPPPTSAADSGSSSSTTTSDGSTTTDMLSALIQQLLGNYTGGASDIFSSLLADA